MWGPATKKYASKYCSKEWINLKSVKMSVKRFLKKSLKSLKWQTMMIYWRTRKHQMSAVMRSRTTRKYAKFAMMRL
ncbi:MAG: DUF2750 domain-containing protein [Proteobacteria bacterium]|nr:DUF2750 domain-containing protein [Pseudomonadota bacterium]